MNKFLKPFSIVWFLLALAIGNSPINAQSQARIQKIETAWTTWLDSQNARESALVISYNGKVVHTAGRKWKANKPVTMASLSKAITGACIETLASKRKLSLNSKMSEFFTKGELGFDPGNKTTANLTIAQLLTHSGGLGPDTTQRTMAKWIGSKKNRHDDVTQTVFKRKKQRGPKGRFSYNNENYAILGTIIAKVSGQSYFKYCKSAVLAPLGVNSAKLSRKFGSYAAWGGWEMSTLDYAKFVNGTFRRSGRIGRNPDSLAKINLGRGAKYGMGTFYRKFNSGHNFWHFGLLCFSSGKPFGAFFAIYEGKWSITTTYADCPSDPEMNRLDELIWKSALQ